MPGQGYKNQIIILMEKKSFFENISEIKENIRDYLETKLSIYLLTGFQKAVKASTVILANSIIFFLFSLSLFFVSAAAAIYIGDLMESTVLGLLVVGGAYLFLGIVVYFFKKQIFSRIIISFLSDVFFKDDDDELMPGENKK